MNQNIIDYKIFINRESKQRKIEITVGLGSVRIFWEKKEIILI